ncbi:glutamyl-tRNA amidotransferase [Mycoplasma enhydrae]|uniref:glutamyl-tRNA amidotransferase n=1 Tax=Mycoplasma enhydrae TaxID=2499220 RepID=UPI00197B5CB2|nr:glutamyl-tRNA amidotransferase [Mycoplasma enhydrae]MBN4089437.1 glutamyl-tRNA amidotransferase [Mycoplasma enhydrae]MCV3733493.1 glutamyl-tRNA amidotransferase [Mycoplasma enhydrae]MCV3753259.1 glutamyl-tRNA amidotransferase [Mycoplasma enhydrae]
MTDQKLKELASNLMLEPTEEILIMARNLLASIDKELKDLDEYNLDDIKPLSHINEKPVSFLNLRGDEVNHETKISREELLNNASTTANNLVTMKKVIDEK